MRQLLILLVVVAAAVIAAIGWAFKHLPWWQAVALVVGLIVVAKFVAGRLFTWALSIPFKWKGAVLKGATVRVNSVTPAATSNQELESSGATDSDAGAEGVTRNQFVLDVTVTPNEPTGKFTHWGPNDLALVKPESKLRIHGTDDEDDSCQVKRIEVEENGHFKKDEGTGYAGSQRLRLFLTVQPGVTRLKFRYYFEEFGEVTLPPHPDLIVNPGRERDQAA